MVKSILFLVTWVLAVFSLFLHEISGIIIWICWYTYDYYNCKKEEVKK